MLYSYEEYGYQSEERLYPKHGILTISSVLLPDRTGWPYRLPALCRRLCRRTTRRTTACISGFSAIAFRTLIDRFSGA